MKKSLAAYGVALAALAAAVLLRWLLDPWLGDSLPLVTLFGAVAAAVWAGGWAPALAAAVAGFFACNYLFIPPRGSWGLQSLRDVVGFLTYVVTCTAIIGLGQAMRTATRRADVRRDTLRVTLASMGDAVITTDNACRVVTMNSVAETLTGWTTAEAENQPLETVFRVVDEETHEPVENPGERALREGVVAGLSNHSLLLRRDGSAVPVDDSAAPIKDQHGVVAGCVLIFRDITERRRTEREEADRLGAARFLAALVESSGDAIVSKSLTGVIQSWNASAERLFGFTASEAIGQHISIIIPKDRLAEEELILGRIRAGDRIEHFETVRVRKTGEPIHVSLTVSPIVDEAGRIVGASKTARDITDRKETEERIYALLGELKDADRRKDEFLAILAHELRNPLAPLRNVVEIMKQGPHEPDVLRSGRDTMERQIDQLVRLVDDLLDVSRITRDKLELRKDRIDLESIVHQAVEASRPLADAGQHQITVSLPPEPVWLDADPVRLVQVFANLLNNACKYSEPGSRISVAAQRNAEDVSITVKDGGIGIPPDQLKHVFDLFAQVDRTLERSRGGLGIGLTLVKRLVEMHGGTIEARSEGKGMGSEFVVRLPMASRAPIEDAPEATAAVPSRRFLVVDDNRDAAVSLAMLLRIAGHETHTAHDGLEAVEMTMTCRPHVILLDIGLPKLNGYDACRRIREQPWGKTVLIVALTGWGQEEDRKKSREAGFDAHMVKPIDYVALTSLLAAETSARPAGDVPERE